MDLIVMKQQLVIIMNVIGKLNYVIFMRNKKLIKI